MNTKCPYCGGVKCLDFSKGNGGDEQNGLLYYTAICDTCNKEVVSVYKWYGYVSKEDFEKMLK